MKRAAPMMSALFKRTAAWLPVALVLAVVLLGGARLIVLSLQQHAAAARETAGAMATQLATRIERQLQLLTDRATRQAARAVVNGGARTALTATLPDHNGFWMSAEGVALPSKATAASMASSIASEWASASGGLQRPSVLGPMREGSRWIVAARVPVVPADAGEDMPALGWSVVYDDLDKLLSAAHLGRLVNAGYDFAILQAEPRSEDPRVFVSSSAAPLATSVVRSIHLPATFGPAIAGSDLQVSIRPRAGWYPVSELATEIGLLAVIAWLLAFGTHDLIHSLHRLQERLAASRQRQHALSARLSTEMEQRQDLQKSFDHARYHDAFTGLPNRRYFINQLDRALREVRTRRRQRVGVILVDITRFRLINDTLGHTAGDELMVQAARRFANATAAFECVLARWGGDQFAVLLLDVPAPDSTMALARVLQAALQAPFDLRRHRLSITASVGLTSADTTPQRAEDVIREADIALSAAKKDETTRIVAYVAAMGGQAASLVSLEADLHVALANNELRLLFQPIVDLRNYQMVGAEVLLRWRHPVEGMLTPDRFLAIAEEVGLMVPITRRIIQRACTLAAVWQQRLPQGQEFYLSINLSAAALRDQGLPEYVATMLQETRIPTSALKFEVTEAGLINNVGAGREVLERLHSLGVQLILDDFGTGYSSLNYLQLFPLDYIKIDRPFVNRTGTDRASTAMMAAIVQMAPSLGLTTIAEIIETEAVAEALRQMGCEFGQGYFFSKPVEAELALRFLLDQPFVGLQAGEAGTDAAIEATMQVAAIEDDSPTSILPPISVPETEMQDDEVDVAERGKRPQRTG
jgi:diguanylate cyclase (GGDEF)-like protein